MVFAFSNIKLRGLKTMIELPEAVVLAKQLNIAVATKTTRINLPGIPATQPAIQTFWLAKRSALLSIRAG
jgi:hypothetical protein